MPTKSAKTTAKKAPAKAKAVKNAKVAKKPTASAKSQARKKSAGATTARCEITMGSNVLLWVCITAIVLLFVAVFSYLIPKAKALSSAQNAPSISHVRSPEPESPTAE